LTITGGCAGRNTASDPSGPPPCPTTLIDAVAMPCDASTEATTHGAPYMLSPKPCPKIATGQPPAGFAPAGTKSCSSRLLLPCGCGWPVSVPVAGMYLAAVS
jgi:hypothetical protein